jgi:hypothetical protein
LIYESKRNILKEKNINHYYNKLKKIFINLVYIKKYL